jgi:hypothetical protein
MAEGISEVATEAPNPPPKKKSLFSKKILAPPTEVEEGVDFFSRSHEIFPQRLAEEERRRQKKLVKLERKRTSSSVEEKEPSPYEEKRRRVSNQGLYSSDEEPAQTSRTRRYVERIYIHVAVAESRAGSLQIPHREVANHVRHLFISLKPLPPHSRGATAEIYERRRKQPRKITYR